MVCHTVARLLEILQLPLSGICLGHKQSKQVQVHRDHHTSLDVRSGLGKMFSHFLSAHLLLRHLRTLHGAMKRGPPLLHRFHRLCSLFHWVLQ